MHQAFLALAEHFPRLCRLPRPQLEAYSRALAQILGRPVQRRVLWFFATDTAYEL